MKIANRADRIEPFYVMEVAKAAQALAAKVAGSADPMIFLNIGEPDFTAPPLVQEAANRAIAGGMTQYTPALGLEPLRQALSDWYAQRFGVDVPARRIVITAGASAALQLVSLALINAGDEVLMPDPSYPCNRHFVSAAEGTAVLLPTTAEERFQLSAEKVQAAWNDKTRGVLLASPSNPTGSSIAPDELRKIHDVVKAGGGVTIIDEIYLGLSYDDAYGQTALAIDENIISINSFSKYFNMTGWRLGWAVVPDALAPVMERLAQNLFICASTISQHAALACFAPRLLHPRARSLGHARSRGTRWGLLRLGRLHASCTKAGRAGLLGFCLRRYGTRPPGHHAGARLWYGRHRPVCALFYRQLHGSAARGHCPSTKAAGLKHPY
jgi:aspartate/methionine/tyrosine aminotransferase